MKLIENLQWRYATKKFDPTRKVSEKDLAKIKKAIQLSASSYGLQLYKILIIEDPELRERLRLASWNQPQVTDASHLIVFCNYSDVLPEHIDQYTRLKTSTLGLEADALDGYGGFIKGKMAEMTVEAKSTWTSKQSYVALANLLAICAELRIDACPMEGFEPEKYSEILQLGEQGLNAAVIATIGYRSPEDSTQHNAKVRKPQDQLFESR